MKESSPAPGSISSLKRKLLELRLRQKGIGTPGTQMISRRIGTGPCPLSFAQQRLWFLDQLEPESTVYLMHSGLRIRGEVDALRLEQALLELIQRHESLRTIFVIQDDLPMQVIQPIGNAQLPVIDLCGVQQKSRKMQAWRLARQEAQRSCDLARGPLLRIYLLRLEMQEHALLFTLHHIITDAWSNDILRRELIVLYQAFVAGQPSPLAPLPIQYADYALWQREWLQGEVLEAQLAYWRQQLIDVPTLQLPTDLPRPVTRSYRGAQYAFKLPGALPAHLQNLSQQEGATLFMLLLAAFQVLLYHASGQEDIAVGTDVANRTQTETEGLIGFFVNQLVLRTRLSKYQTFRELLQQVRNTTLDAYRHQDVPFEKLVEVLQPKRNAGTAPFFSVKILLQSISEKGSLSQTEVDMPDVYTLTHSAELTVEVDLILRFSQTPHGIWGFFDYRTDLFESASIERMSHHFLTLLENVSANPNTSLAQLEMVDQQKKEKKHMKRKERETFSLSTQLKSIRPQSVRIEEEHLIRTDYLSAQETLPLVIRPQVAELSLHEWAQSHLPFLETALLKHGALLFRGFQVPTPEDFERFASVLCPDLFHENGEHVPVNDVGHGNLYTPVFYAPDKKLLWHNENSFNAQWPMKILFYCAHPAEQGGETPIADSRNVFQRLDADLKKPFIEKGIMYVRTYGEGLGLSWQAVFRTTDKRDVEVQCHENAIDFEWKDGDRLQTRQVRPAVLKHPQSGEMVWWNQAPHWHPACLDPEVRAALLTLFTPENLPRNCFYGDGTPIEEMVIQAICHAYEEAEISFPWSTGDILVLDNMLTAHARNPYQGKRKIYVSMGKMTTLQDL